MPFYSDHYYGSSQLPSYYLPSSPYTSATSRISSPYSFSYMSPISAMLSASIGTNPVPRGLRTYSPMLSSISESGSPLISRRDLGSPRHISGKTYYRQPRPVVIDTDSIDVSRRNRDDINELESTPGLISRGKTIVRMHTKKLKENPELKKKKKTQAELLMEKYLIKEKPKEEIPKKKRVWEEREEELSKIPAQAGIIKRTNTVHRKFSGQLSTPEDIVNEEIKEPFPQRKTSIDSDLLKAEAAIFDCMIQEELGYQSRNEIYDNKNIEKPDPSSLKHKTKREFLPYGKKKSSHLLDENGLPIEKKKSHFHKKKSSRNLPLDEVNLDEVFREGNTNQAETDSAIIKRRTTKKKKNLSGPLKFKIDALHVEEKSSPKLLRKFQYEVIVEEGDKQFLKKSPQKSDNQLDNSCHESIPDILRNEPVNNNKRENNETCDKTNDSNPENIANISFMSKTCDSECDSRSGSENSGNCTEHIEISKAIGCDKETTQCVQVLTEDKKENSSLKNTEEYMNKFKIKGFLEKQQKIEKESEGNKTSPLLDKRKHQKTDSIQPKDSQAKDSTSRNIKTDTTPGNKTEQISEDKCSGVKLNIGLKSIDNQTDHSIESVKGNNITSPKVSELHKIINNPTNTIGQKQNLFLLVDQPLFNQQNVTSSAVTPSIPINVTPSTPVSSEGKQVLQSLESAELQKFGENKLPKFNAKSSPNTPILSKKQFNQSSTFQNSSENADIDGKPLKKKLPKSHPNTPILSKKETLQENKKQPIIVKSLPDKTHEKQNIVTLELSQKITPNESLKPSTPVLQRKEIIQKDVKPKLGTPDLERKYLNKESSESNSNTSTSLLLSKNILQENKAKPKIDIFESDVMTSSDKDCKSSLDTPVLHSKNTSKFNTVQPKTETFNNTRKYVSEETIDVKQNIPSVIEEKVLQKKVDNKICLQSFDQKKCLNDIPTSKPSTPILLKKEIKNDDLVYHEVETPNSDFDPWKTILGGIENKYEDAKTLNLNAETSKSTSITEMKIPQFVNKKSTMLENVDQVKAETPVFARKKLGDDKPKSNPNTPVFKKKEIAQESSTHKTIEIPSISKETEQNAVIKSNHIVLQNEESVQETHTQEAPHIGEKGEVNTIQKANITTPVLHKKQIVQETLKPKFGSPEIGKKFTTNVTIKSDPSTPVLTKKELPSENSPLILQQKFGTPELGRKKLFNITPKSDPSTPVMLKKQIVDPKISLQNEASVEKLSKENSNSKTEKVNLANNIPSDESDKIKQNNNLEGKMKSNIDVVVNKQTTNFEDSYKNPFGKGDELMLKKPLLPTSEDILSHKERVAIKEVINVANTKNINSSPFLSKQKDQERIIKKPEIVDKPITKEKAVPSKVDGLKNVFSKTGKVEDIKAISNVNVSDVKSQDSTENKDQANMLDLKIGGKTEKLVKESISLTTKKEETPTLVKKLIKQNAVDEISEASTRIKQDQDKSVVKNTATLPTDDKPSETPIKHTTQTKLTTELTKTDVCIDKTIELISEDKEEIIHPNTETSTLELSGKITKQTKDVDLEKEIHKKEAIEIKESRKKRIKSESDVPSNVDTPDVTNKSADIERKGSKSIEKSKSLDESKSEKSSKKKKRSKDKDSSKKKCNSKSPKKLKDVKPSSLDLKEIIQEKKSQKEAQKQTSTSNNMGNSSLNESGNKGTDTTAVEKNELSKSEVRLLHFINKCIKLSADDENISVEMSDESSSSSEYTSDSDSEYTSDSEEETLTDDSSDDNECDVNCHRKCEKLMPNLCGVNQKLIVEALSSLRKGSSESRDHGSPTRRHSNAALSLDEERSHPGRVTPPATTIPKFRKYALEDFQFLKVLGKGSFGKVLLAELRGTQYYYAVKCLKKDVVLEDDDVECTLIERKVLALGTNHPYLCHLFCTFQTDSHLFFVMEYLNGGDLMFHIQQQGRFDEGRARFYAAEIVSGLKFLHKKGIIYRDLKLDNILLDFDGHVRIADFGMCKLQIFLDRTADTFCGTPDYMAPEIIKGLNYNQCVDWWSFGILLYEMLVGQSPFSGCDEDDLFWCICNRQPHYPRFITLEAKRILSQLLEKEATKRLGSCENGAEEVIGHPFFNGLDWGRLERRELMPPFKPNVKHPLDVHYFDKHFTAERACLTPIDPSILQSMDQTQFQGFSYTNPNVTE